MDQDLADFDALAARAQGVLKGLSTANDAHPAQHLGKVDADVCPARRRDDALLCERQVAQARLNNLQEHSSRAHTASC